MNLVFATANQLAQMIRDKEISATEVLYAYLKQIEKYDKKINAIATLNREKAKQRAIEADDDKNLSDIRIAWSDSWEKMPPASEIMKAINLAVDRLKPECGEMKQWASPPFNLPEAFQVCNRLTALNFVYSQPVDFDASKKNLPVMFREATQGDKELRDLSNLSQFLPALLNPTLKEYFELLTQRDRLIAQMDEALETWDVWLCPVAMTTAFTHRLKGKVIEIEGRKVPYFLANGGYTMLFNLTGNPAIVIPIGQSKTGLPIGMQIIGKRWREMELLAIADKINRVAGDFQYPSL